MPTSLYDIPPLQLGLLMVAGLELVSLAGLVLARRYVLPHLHYHEGVNDAVSGTVQAIGVFYGITVGLIAVGVWNTYTNASDLVSQEAAAIGALYRDASSFPEPLRGELQAELRDYTVAIIEKSWPEQKRRLIPAEGKLIVDRLEDSLMSFEPATEGQKLRYAETLTAFNRLIEQRRLRLDALQGGLSGIMWAVIWIGAAISIGVAYFFHIEDFKMHAIMVGLMAGFLGIVLFMIIINDNPFAGQVSVGPDSYQLILDTLINAGGH